MKKIILFFLFLLTFLEMFSQSSEFQISYGRQEFLRYGNGFSLNYKKKLRKKWSRVIQFGYSYSSSSLDIDNYDGPFFNEFWNQKTVFFPKSKIQPAFVSQTPELSYNDNRLFVSFGYSYNFFRRKRLSSDFSLSAGCLLSQITQYSTNIDLTIQNSTKRGTLLVYAFKRSIDPTLNGKISLLYEVNNKVNIGVNSEVIFGTSTGLILHHIFVGFKF